MQASVFNKICAHPMMVTWVLGASVLNVLVIGSIIREISFSAVISDWEMVLLLILAVVPISGFGFYLGMFTCWLPVRIFCSRYNGAPLKVGDQVHILSGPQKGAVANVYEIITGQGGWELARLDLGAERAKKFRDIFEQYSVLKISEKPTSHPPLQDPSKEPVMKK
jgi:hypothetical protein